MTYIDKSIKGKSIITSCDLEGELFVNTNINTEIGSTFDIGSSTKTFKKLYVDSINISGANYIQPSSTAPINISSGNISLNYNTNHFNVSAGKLNTITNTLLPLNNSENTINLNYDTSTLGIADSKLYVKQNCLVEDPIVFTQNTDGTYVISLSYDNTLKITGGNLSVAENINTISPLSFNSFTNTLKIDNLSTDRIPIFGGSGGLTYQSSFYYNSTLSALQTNAIIIGETVDNTTNNNHAATKAYVDNLNTYLSDTPIFYTQSGAERTWRIRYDNSSIGIDSTGKLKSLLQPRSGSCISIDPDVNIFLDFDTAAFSETGGKLRSKISAAIGSAITVNSSFDISVNVNPTYLQILANQITFSASFITDFGSVQTRLATAEGNITGLSSSLAGLSGTVTALSASLTTVQIGLAVATATGVANTLSIAGLNGNIASIDSQLSGLYGRETTLSAASYYIGQSLGLITPGPSGTLTSTGYIDIASTVNTIGNLFMTGGSIGINTTSPNYTFDIAGTSGSLRAYNGNFVNVTNSNIVSSNSTFTNTIITNLTTANLFLTNSTITNILATNISSSNLFSTIGTISNLRSINSTINNIICTNITLSSILSTNLLTTNSTINNIISTNANFSNITSTNVLTTNITASNVLTTNVSSTNVSSTNLISTNTTTTNANFTNITSSNLISSGITSNNLLSTNVISTNVTSTNLNVSNGTIPNLISSNVNTLGLTSSNSTLSNLFTTDISTGTVRFTNTSATSGITFGANVSKIYDDGSLHIFSNDITYFDIGGASTAGTNIMYLNSGGVGIYDLYSTNNIFTNLSTGSARITLATIPNLITTNISSSSIISTNGLITNLSTSNVISTNTTTTNLLVSNSTIANIFTLGLTSVYSTQSNIFTTNITSTNIISTDISSGTLRFTNTSATSGITFGANVSKIYDNGQLNIYSNDNINFNIGGSSTAGTNIMYLNSGGVGIYNLYSTNNIFTNLSTGSARITLATIPNLITTNISSSSLTITNGLITNLSITNLISNNGTIANILSSNVNTLGLFSFNSTLSNLLTTSVTSTNLLSNSVTCSSLRLPNLTTTGGIIFGPNASKIYDDADLHFYTDDNIYFEIGTSGNIMNINNTGVGITASLFCTNNELTNITSTNVISTNLSTGSLRLPNTSATSGITFGGNASRIYDDSQLHIYTDDHLYFDIGGSSTGGNNKMYLGTTGLGIGTTSPSVKIDFGTNAANQLLALYNNKSVNGFFGMGANNSTQYYMSGVNHQFLTGSSVGGLGTAQLTILSNGNIGMGNVSPSYRLDVSGDVRFTSGLTVGSLNVTNTKMTNITISNVIISGGNVVLNDSKLYLRTNGDNNHYLQYDSSLDGPALVGFGGGYIKNNSKYIMYWNSSGLVGINTTDTASAQLNVNGFVKCTSLSVIGSGSLSGSTNWYCDGGGIAGRSASDSDYCATFNSWVLFNNGWRLISDARIKENVQELESNDNFNKIRPVKFDYIDKKKDSNKQYGLIAQEVEELYPEFISEKEDYLPNVMENVVVLSKNSFKLRCSKITGNKLLVYLYEDEQQIKKECKVISNSNGIVEVDIDLTEKVFVYGTLDKVKNVNYTNFIPILIKELQQANKKIEILEKKLQSLDFVLLV